MGSIKYAAIAARDVFFPSCMLIDESDVLGEGRRGGKGRGERRRKNIHCQKNENTEGEGIYVYEMRSMHEITLNCVYTRRVKRLTCVRGVPH